MSRNYEIKNKELIEKKPYLTKKELSILLEKKGKNLDKKINLLIRDNFLIPLKKGLYTTRIYTLVNKNQSMDEYLANIIYYPSYLSLEYVLAKEGIIAEAVYVYTSVSLKTTRVFKNNLGTFSYRKIKDNLFTGYQQKDFSESYKIKIASKAKALFDWFYLRPWKTYFKSIEDMRINWSNLSQSDMNEFFQYTKMSRSEKMIKTYKLINQFYDNR